MRLRLLLPLLAACLALASCGGGDPDPPPATEGAAATAGAFPVTVAHAHGRTTIPREPKRIVTVGLRDHDTLLALGVKAVGAMDWFQQGTFAKWPWEHWGGSPPEIVSSGGFEINFERVAAQRPDLILGVYQDLSAGDYAKLSKLAPTVAQSADHEAYTTPWRDETRTIATAVGRREAGERLIAAVDRRYAAVRKAHPEYRGKTAVMIDPAGTPYAFGSTDPRGQFLRELGFAPAEALDAATKGEFGVELSDERLDLIDVDRLFVLLDAKGRDALYRNPVFRRLDVVRRGDVVEVPYYDRPQTGAAIAFNSALSLPYAIDGTVELIDAAAAARDERR
ncbi:iron-siderophore ABC transporter substrate-binding protein [Patulibacter sp. S7RM1-6]